MRVLTLYKNPSPGLSIKSGEYYELALWDDPADGGFAVKEFHGNWDGLAQDIVPGSSSVVILSPEGGYPSIEEAEAAFDKQKMIRARQGFLHGLRPGYHPSEPIYEFVDVDEKII
jgi:hypothetical protein